MKIEKIAGVALLLLPSLLSAEKKPKVAEAINQAHTVYVQAADGEETKPGLSRQDMQAIANVRTLLRGWGRYTVINERSKADLIFVVRTAVGGGNNGEGPQMGRGTQGNGGGAGAGGDMPAPQGGQQFPGQGRDSINPDDNPFNVDRLDVCQLKPNGKLTGALWSRALDGGLAPPRLLLFAQFKDDVEKAYPAPVVAAPQPTAP